MQRTMNFISLSLCLCSNPPAIFPFIFALQSFFFLHLLFFLNYFHCISFQLLSSSPHPKTLAYIKRIRQATVPWDHTNDDTEVLEESFAFIERGWIHGHKEDWVKYRSCDCFKVKLFSPYILGIVRFVFDEHLSRDNGYKVNTEGHFHPLKANFNFSEMLLWNLTDVNYLC